MLLRASSLALGVVPFLLHSSTLCPGNSCPWHVGTQAQSCLPQLSAGSCLFPLPSASLHLELWGLVLGCPRSQEISRGGVGFIQQMERPFLILGAGLWEVFIPGMRAVPGRWLWVLGAFPLAGGVSRARLIAKRMAGQVNAAVSCSSLAARVCFPLFGSLLALTCLRQLRWLRLCRANALPGCLIKRREDVFQKPLASLSACSVLLSWCRGGEASSAFS